MQESIPAHLIGAAWDDIQKAVTSGLAAAGPYGVPRPTLDTVAVVSTEKLSTPSKKLSTRSTEKLSTARTWHPLHIPGAPPHVRVEESEDARDIMHHYQLSYHELRSPDTEAIERWAAAARRFELSLGLQHFAQSAVRRSFVAGQLYQADPDGWGQRRCVVFSSAVPGSIPDKWDRADLERMVKVDVDPANGIQALVFRIAGGPYVRRPDDLTLGWAPAAHCTAELLLTEQFEFVNVKASTIIGIDKVSPGV